MACPAGDTAPLASTSLGGAPRRPPSPLLSRPPSPPAAVHFQRQPESVSSPSPPLLSVTTGPSLAPCGPPPTYDEAMGLHPAPNTIRDWARPNSDCPPAYYEASDTSDTHVEDDPHDLLDFLECLSTDSSRSDPAIAVRCKASVSARNAAAARAGRCVDTPGEDWTQGLGESPGQEATPMTASRACLVEEMRRCVAMSRESQDLAFMDSPWTPYAMRAVCPHCERIVCTDIVVEDAEYTHICALGLCLIGCWPFCLVPYCMDACRRVSHTCPRCRMYLGSYSPRSPNRPRERTHTRTRPRARAPR